MFEGAKQAVKLHLGRLVPVHLHQAGEQGVLLVVEKEAVGQVESLKVYHIVYPFLVHVAHGGNSESLNGLYPHVFKYFGWSCRGNIGF